MNILILDGSGADGRLALVTRSEDRPTLLRDLSVPGRGGAERLAGQLRDLLDATGWSMATVELIAAIVGPGSFTGLRATLALAHGLRLGSGCSLIGVTLGEALRRTVGPRTQPVWCVTRARRGRVFLDRGPDGPAGCLLDDLPRPDAGADGGSVLLAGDASEAVAASLGPGAPVRSLGIEHPHPLDIVGVAMDRLAGRLQPLAAQPLYVDPPEARRPASGLRPSPA